MERAEVLHGIFPQFLLVLTFRNPRSQRPEEKIFYIGDVPLVEKD